jgi:glucose/arabinose dehydrogenase
MDMRRALLPLAVMALTVLACVGALLALPTERAQGAATLPTDFTDSPFVSGLTSPTDMEFAPDGRLFVTEQAGSLRIARPDETLSTILDISTKVDSNGERGLLGLTFDPRFSTNGYLYLYYTRKATSSTPAHNRVVRVRARGEKVVSGSEKLILRLENLSSHTNHNGGAIHFGEDGKLYVAVGENANGENAQSLGNLFGKILRINKSGTIPTDNPFYAVASGKNRAIWALGLRNPFKFAIQPTMDTTTGPIYINDVGEGAWEEINRGASGANYGWNLCEGNHDNPNTPGSVNCSAAPYTPPVHEYAHGSTDTTGCSITGGTFYNPTTGQFPSGYVGDYFFADFCNGWIRTYDPSTNAATGFATGLSGVVDLEVSKNEGELYYLSRGSPGTVSKIGYIGN